MALSFFQGVQWLVDRMIEKISEAVLRLLVFWKTPMDKGALKFFAWSAASLILGATLAFGVNRLLGPAATPTRNLVLFIAPFALVWTIAMLSIATALLLAVFIALLVPLLIVLAVKPCGLDLALATLWLELAFESTPLGEWRVITSPTSSADAELRHSLGYGPARSVLRR